ncbi:MAG TPA: efflux RND transporter periplasmic adaptor subunit [Anaerolineales bacterium]|nr:efflux RND transporter periplasmic adaptor subunit [Anaerolineales bacterium]
MKLFYRSMLAALAVALTAFTIPAVAAPAKQSAGIVTASAVVAPEQTSQMSFLISGPVKEVDVKEGDQVKAGQTLIVLNTPNLSYAVVEAQAALTSAQADAQLQRYTHKTWNGSKFISLSGPPELRQIADDKVTQAQAALDIAQAELVQNTLVAPYDGTIVQVNVVPGEMIQATQVAVVIGTLNHLRIETTDLSERDVPKLSIGQAATVHIESMNQDFTGKVASISPKSDTVGGDVVYKVIIELDTQPAGLLWGMSAVVNIGQ